MRTVGKFTVQSFERNRGFEGTRFKLSAVADKTVPEDALFHKYTPSGEINIHVNNPPAEEVFQKAFDGQEALYVTFSSDPPMGH